jgi:hypothetical protein
MDATSLKQAVVAAIRAEWPTFEKAHPALAEVLDEAVLVEQAVMKLADDPEFQQSLTQAKELGLAADTLVDLASKFAGTWLKALV